jgi:CheY-like chemotaxis protein
MAESSVQARILMVDDEPNVLDGYRRALHGRITLVTATSGAEGLTLVQQASEAGDPFAVVVSDMMMPTMNGAEFLGRAHTIEPDAIQLLLSGQADLESTIAAVNNGSLFRFLTKPCATPDLEKALAAALEQHRLVRAERDLLERTLAGAVDVLTELVSLSSPEVLSRTERVRTIVATAAAELELDDWRLPLAAMLSQIGCMAVPDDVLERARNGIELSPDELEVYLSHPTTGRQLLERIPRLEDVARWIGNQPVRPPGQGAADRAWQEAPPGTSTEPAEVMLRTAIVLLATLDETGHLGRAVHQLEKTGRYPGPVLTALGDAATGLATLGTLRELSIDQVRPGMLLDADVVTKTGMTLVRRGERISEAAAMRLANFARTVGVQEPIMVMDGA